MPLTHQDQTILYHALGANLDDGLERFETAYRQAETIYQLVELDTLINLLRDPTLPDERLTLWRRYYMARKAWLLWDLQQADRLLQTWPDVADLHVRHRLQPRLHLLQAQIELRRGNWGQCRAFLHQALVLTDVPLTVQAEVYETLTQSWIDQAYSVGGWARTAVTGLDQVWRWIMQLMLLPMYLIVGGLLYITDRAFLWQPLLEFGGNYSNWPVLRYYFSALHTLRQARQFAGNDAARSFRLDLMQASLLSDLTAFRAAEAIYQKLLAQLDQAPDRYSQALIQHGLAKALSQRAKTTPVEQVFLLLQTARKIYQEMRDDRAVAYVDFLLGDQDLKRKALASALTRWQTAIVTCQKYQDAIGVMQGLERCYALLDHGGPADMLAQVRAMISRVTPQVFAARMPHRLYRIIQSLSGAVPLLVVLAIIGQVAGYMQGKTAAEYQVFIQQVLSWQGVMLVADILVGGIVLNALLGLIGLLAALWQKPAELEFFIIDNGGIACLDTANKHPNYIRWTAVKNYVRVERGLFARPNSALSHDWLLGQDSRRLELPGTIVWFKYLQQAIEARLGQPRQVFQLQAYGGLIIACTGLVYLFSFWLTQSIFYPALSVTTHAWLVTGFQIVAFLAILYVTGRWIKHFLEVARLTQPSRSFVLQAGLFGLSLILLGESGKRLLFPLGALVIGWGVIILNHLIRIITALRPLYVIGWLIGLGLIAQSWVPVTLHAQNFTYTSAMLRYSTESVLDDADTGRLRSDYFGHVRELSQWMIALDPTYPEAYDYLGLAAYYFHDFRVSIDAYTHAITLEASPEQYYCRAIARYAIGDVNQAREDYRVYRTGRGANRTPRCLVYFPDKAAVFDTQ